MSKSARNMELVCKAKAHHDATCLYDGKAIEVHIHPGDLTKLEWDTGDVICGLTVVADEKVTPSRMRVYCDIELHGQGAGEQVEARETVMV